MRIVFCDRCGQQGSERRTNDSGVRIVRLTISPHGIVHSGRTLDLCGACRSALPAAIDSFLGALRVPVVPGGTTDGDAVVSAAGPGEEET